jgi:hypothetical protein
MLARRVLVILCLSTVLFPACKRRPKAEDAPPELPETLVSTLKISDPAAVAQLTHGFYGLEQNSWRWTAGKFGVALGPPAGAAERGAQLSLKFSLPEPVLKQGSPVTLSATLNGTSLRPQRYDSSGEHTYAADVPSSALQANAAVEFSIDKFLPAGAVDARELGLIVLEVGLASK